MEFDEVREKLKLVEQDLETQKELLEIERQKNQEKKESKKWDTRVMEK